MLFADAKKMTEDIVKNLINENKIFCDIADYKTIKFFNNKSSRWVTTNPSLMRLAEQNKDYSKTYICKTNIF